MAKVTKKLADVRVGDVQVHLHTVVEKHETQTHWTLVWDDGQTETFDKATDPAIETGQ